TETLETPELLVDAGIKYVGDWVYDDEPTTIRTAKGPLVTLPYTLELNDIPMMIVQHHESDYLQRRISGQPHRIKYLEAIYDHVRRHDGVVFWTGEEILDWYEKARA